MLSGVFCCIIQTSHAFVALFLRERVLVSSTRPLCTWKEGVTHCPQEHCSPAQLNDPSRALHFGHSSCAGRKNAFTLILCIKMCAYLLASYPGLLIPALVACSTNAGIRRPGWGQGYIPLQCEVVIQMSICCSSQLVQSKNNSLIYTRGKSAVANEYLFNFLRV